MNTLLDAIREHSIVVVDSGDLDAIQAFAPYDATTNPSIILKAAESGQFEAVIDQVIADIQQQQSSPESQIEAMCDHLTVAMGCEILRHIPGRVSTEVSAHLSFDCEGSVAKARKLIGLYRQRGIEADRVLIKLAATWEGIRAAEILEREGIRCNLTLIFNFTQAQACAEAGAFLISPFVGRILDWHRKAEPERTFPPADEPGVNSVKRIQTALKAWRYPTIVMGASFRNIGEIVALAGCDRLTIAPALLAELQQTRAPENFVPALKQIKAEQPRPQPLTESAFRWAMNEDAMATEKLAEGIRGFAADQRKLVALLAQRSSVAR